MEYIFLLAERIVSNLKSELISQKKTIGYYSFESCIIHNTSFEITFSSNVKDIIILKLSTHPLDMPWNINLVINGSKVKNDYEVYPKLLGSPDSLGNELAFKLAKDIIRQLKIKKS
ncbi:hypothetical protein WJR50_00960 [Catalinimonas sp. 4WD22]|uniref:hypothetical protein n=1 Tax=Catalinimonas locisalis TaxID=3133978 RepID=UPI00310107C6